MRVHSMLAATAPRWICARAAALRAACEAAAALHTSGPAPMRQRSRLLAAMRSSMSCANAAPFATSTAASPPRSVAAAAAVAAHGFDSAVTSDTSFAAFLSAWTAPNSTLHPHTADPSATTIPHPRPVCVVAVSGGVDSAVTALLCTAAQSAGLYSHVVAVHMRNWDEIEERGVCSGEKDALDASRLCASLNLPLEFLDFSREYYSDVFQPLLADYAKGFTPSPDVLCNRLIKFNLLLEEVRRKYGGDAVLATGHYARLKYHAVEPLSSVHNSASLFRTDVTLAASFFSQHPPVAELVLPPREPQLFKALDPRKDQSYFLSSVPASALKQTVFPLGHFYKSFVKNSLATGRWAASIMEQRAKLPRVPQAQPIAWRASSSSGPAAATAASAPAAAASPTLPSVSQPPLHALSSKKESMGICFIGKRDLGDFLGGYLTLHPGLFVDVDTRQALQEHQGWETWTMGQRAPISGAAQKMYVCAKSVTQLLRAGESADSESWYVTPLAPPATTPRLSHRSFSPRGKLIIRRDPPPSAPLPVPPPAWTVWVCSSRLHPSLWCDDMELETPEWISAQEPIMEEQQQQATQRGKRPKQQTQQRREWRMSVSIKIRSSGEQTSAVLIKTVHAPIPSGAASSAAGSSAASAAPVHYRIESARPLHAVAPGQSCVLYDSSGHRCLGQARIAQAGLSYFQRNKPLPLTVAQASAQQSASDSAAAAAPSTAAAAGAATNSRDRSLPLTLHA